jgi:hypothetical protein
MESSSGQPTGADHPGRESGARVCPLPLPGWAHALLRGASPARGHPHLPAGGGRLDVPCPGSLLGGVAGPGALRLAGWEEGVLRQPEAGGGGGLENPEFDIWVVDWEGGDAFGEPRRLGEEVNTPGYENYPAVTADGSLYFSRRVPGSGTDLFHALPDGDGFHPAQPVQELNSPGSDADPWVDPDGRRMIFSSVRGDGAGQGDLYVSYLCREGWTTPWNLGPRVNTEAYEYTPAVSPDGEWLLFSRDRWDVFRIPMAQLEVQTPCPPVDGGRSSHGTGSRDPGGSGHRNLAQPVAGIGPAMLPSCHVRPRPEGTSAPPHISYSALQFTSRRGSWQRPAGIP